MMQRLVAIVETARRRGLHGAVDQVHTALAERWYERQLGVQTGGTVPLASLAQDERNCHDYMPIAYRAFREAMKRVQVESDVDVFVDYGAGKGRVVVSAALHPFRRVIGIELVDELAAIGRENLRRAAGRLRCRDAEILTADATKFRLPDDATFLHFYNPFRGGVLASVADEIERSWRAAPRTITILFANPGHFEEQLRSRVWPLSREDVQWPGYERADPDSNRYRIYRMAAERR